MSSTFLDLTNELLRELNEVPLTAANFASAVGVQQHVKDSVNRAYFDIVVDEPQWPFLAVDESGTVDPMYGNVARSTTEGTRWYDLKEAATHATDYGSVDWDNFYITTVGVTGETAPYVGQNLRYMTTEEWKDFQREQENVDDADNKGYGEPKYVIRSPDGRKFGLSPIPDKEYKVWFYAWALPAKMSVATDAIVFPEIYSAVLLAKARYYIWQFKDNPQHAAFALDDFKKGYRSMRSNLLEPTPMYFKDDRVRYI